MTGRIAPARRIAFDLLVELGQRPDAHSDRLLRTKPVEALSPVDRNLATTLVMAVLRWRIALRQRIVGLLTRGGSLPPEPVMIALELGAAQLLLFDRLPAHAVIFDSVELAKTSGNPHAAGMVNAVLRKLAVGPKRIGPGTPGSPSSAAPSPRRPEQLARLYAHPAWMVERWTRAFGVLIAEAICRFDQQVPPLTIRLLDPSAERLFEEHGISLEPGTFVTQARRAAGDVSWALDAGLVRIQDEASQLVAELAAEHGWQSTDSQHAGSRSGDFPASARLNGSSPVGSPSILDCCAAPGGKTAILAERNRQAAITACDISPVRLKAMQSQLARVPGSERINFQVLDAANLPYRRSFDLVLCDAPCSGTGTIARNPEIRHRLHLEALHRHHERQVKLLSSALRALAPGGRLVYSTCSLEPEENESVVAEVLDREKGLKLLSCRDELRRLEENGVLHKGSAELVTPSGSGDQFLRTFPGVQPCDGFFAAVIVRDD